MNNREWIGIGQMLPTDCEIRVERTSLASVASVAAWSVAGLQLMKFPSMNNAIPWKCWVVGFMAVLIIHRMRRGNARSVRLLSGICAILAVVMLHRCVRLSAGLMGVSHALSILSLTNAARNRAIGYFMPDGERERQLKIKMLCTYAGVLLLVWLMCKYLGYSPLWQMINAVIVSAALISSALIDPLAPGIIEKVEKCRKMQLTGKMPDGAVIESMKRELENYRCRPWGMDWLMGLGRAALRYHCCYEDESVITKDMPTVYLANHGNVFGVIANRVYTPAVTRVWAISKIMNGREDAAEYMYRYTFSKKKYIPAPLRMPTARFLAFVLDYAMHGLRAIPVYRDSPKELRKTFSETVDALRSGDSILLFPENPNVHGEMSGYEQNKVGSLYSGFAMIGQLVWMRCGFRCRFVPMFADRKAHTVTFGKPVIYDPSNPAAIERERIAQEVKTEMDRLSSGS